MPDPHPSLTLQGLWVGMLVGDGIQAAIFAYLVATTDWKMQVRTVVEVGCQSGTPARG